MSKTKTTEVATQPKLDVALPFQYGEDAGQGMDLTMDDLKIPFLRLLQAQSKETIDGETRRIEAARPGMIMNGATKELFPGKDGLVVVPALRIPRHFVEWTPLDKGGGYVASHDPRSEVVTKALAANGGKRFKLKNPATGNDLVETFSMFVITLDAKGNPSGYAIVACTSTKISKWRDYWTRIDAARVSKGAPVFAHRVLLTSVPDKNKHGNFFNFSLAPAVENDVLKSMLPPDSPAYISAKALRDAVQTGRAQADYTTEGKEGEEGAGSDDQVF